jgi:hypothetical protein
MSISSSHSLPAISRVWSRERESTTATISGSIVCARRSSSVRPTVRSASRALTITLARGVMR